jgi:hypothetical protein
MNSLSKFLVESILEEQAGVVVLMPGGFKPPHGGHLALAQKYASLPQVSEVQILIGPTTRDGITREQSVKIWNILLAGQSNIKVIQAKEDNPLLASYKYIESAKPGTYALASSNKGEDYERVKKFVAGHQPGAKYYRNGVNVVELLVNAAPLLYKNRSTKAQKYAPGKSENGKGISASVLRQDLANNDFDAFATNYPSITSQTILRTIFDIVQKRLTESKLRVFDFDDTLVRTNSKVHITKKIDGRKITLTPAEYAKYIPDEGDVPDFSDFVSPIKNAQELKQYTDIMRKALNSDDRDRRTVVLTARANPKVVYDFLMKLGIRVPVVAVGSSDPMKKADWIEQQIADGFNDIYFLDDSIKNIQAVDTLKAKYPNVKIRTQVVPQEKNISESMILNEGGAAGHLAHPYEDYDLTFGDIVSMITAALSGKIESAQEKLDGQNLMITYKDGAVRAARNKGQVKNFGQNSLTTKQMEDMFAGRGPIREAFVEAMNDLETAINRLTKEQKEHFFENGKKFLNLEVLFPETQNVVPYGAAQLRLHHLKEYDEAGNVVGEDIESAKRLEGALRQVEAQNQKTYEIRITDPLNVVKSSDYKNQRDELIGMIKQVMSKYGLKTGDKLSLYFQAWWKNYITSMAKQYNYNIDPNTLQQLIDRWAFDNKAVNIKAIRDGIQSEEFKNWVTEFDKNGLAAQRKIATKPIETMFLKLGVYTLKNIENLVALNPNNSVRNMKADLKTAIQQIKATANDPQPDDAALQFLKRELTRLKDIGGMSAIVPTEGLVYKYNGKLYKLTGAFAPVNQILGYLKF